MNSPCMGYCIWWRYEDKSTGKETSTNSAGTDGGLYVAKWTLILLHTVCTINSKQTVGLNLNAVTMKLQ